MRKGQRTNQKYRSLVGSDQQMQKLEESELRKADRTVGVNCNIFFNVSNYYIASNVQKGYIRIRSFITYLKLFIGICVFLKKVFWWSLQFAFILLLTLTYFLSRKPMSITVTEHFSDFLGAAQIEHFSAKMEH